MHKVQERLDDYASIGAKAMWVIDPWRGTASAAGPDGKLQPAEDVLAVPGTEICIPVADIWAELERLERRAAGPAHRTLPPG